MAMAPVPTPEILWRKPPVLALAALPGTALGHLGEPSTASSAAWAAAGAAVRTLHDAPLPPWPGRSVDELASRLAGECEWLVANDVLPADVVTRNRRLAETALRPWTPVFIHGDLQVDHVFVAGDEVTGVIDWSEASQGDALVRPRHPHARTRGAPWRRRRRLRHRRRPRPHPRVVVVAMPAQRPLAGRARLRPARGVCPRSPCCDPGREAARGHRAHRTGRLARSCGARQRWRSMVLADWAAVPNARIGFLGVCFDVHAGDADRCYVGARVQRRSVVSFGCATRRHVPGGGERTPPLACRSRPLKLGAARAWGRR